MMQQMLEQARELNATSAALADAQLQPANSCLDRLLDAADPITVSYAQPAGDWPTVPMLHICSTAIFQRDTTSR